MSDDARWLRLLSSGGVGLTVEADRFPRCGIFRSCFPNIADRSLIDPRLSRESAIGFLLKGTLGEVQAKDGDSVACQLAVSNIRTSTRLLLHSFGPQAARSTLSETAAALEEDVKFANAKSEWLQ
jgi:hypothetical protein